MISNKANVFWFTGLSGSGKTTIAESLGNILINKGRKVLVLDGDSVRSTINKKLSFSEEDIKTNNLKVASLVKENQQKYDFILVPIISPYRKHRLLVREIIKDNFNELYINCSVEKCVERDTKGLYAKALNGEITNMIGFSSSNPYEPPQNPEVVLNTKDLTLQESLNQLLTFIQEIK
jgi:adenylylsulfate kinase